MYPYAKMGLRNRAEINAYKKTLTDTRRHVRFRARLKKPNGKGVRFRLQVVDGEVVFETRNPDGPDRTATVHIYDPHKRIQPDKAQKRSGLPPFAEYISIEAGVWVGAPVDDWVDCPLFDGQILEVEREGDVVIFTCESRDGGHVAPSTFPRGFSVRRHTRVHEAIRRILRHRGETRFDFPSSSRRLPRDRSWKAGHAPKRACRQLARSINRQLYVRGDGTWRLRARPKKPVWKFKEGRDALVVGNPSERWSRADTRNFVIARGRGRRKRKDGQDRPIRARVQLPDRHYLSSQSLSEGKRPLVHELEASHIHKRGPLIERAKEELRRVAKLEQTIAFDAMPVYHLEDLDLVALDYGGVDGWIPLQAMRIPLNGSGRMSVNFERHTLPAAGSGAARG